MILDYDCVKILILNNKMHLSQREYMLTAKYCFFD